MSSVWISKDSWAKVWAAIHNIRVRMNFTVKEPSVSLSGQGSSARINIDLPCPRSGEGKIYDGPFAVSYDQEEKALVVKAGWINVNGLFISMPESIVECEVQEGLLCLKVVINEDMEYEEGKEEECVLEPEYLFTNPNENCWPLCKVHINEDATIRVEMFNVPPVIQYVIAKQCVFAMKSQEEEKK